MTDKEIVVELMKKKSVKNADMASVLGISPQACWNRLNSQKGKALTADTLSDMLRSIGYDLVIMPRGKAGRIEGAYVVDNTVKPKEKKAPEKVAEKEMTEKAE